MEATGLVTLTLTLTASRKFDGPADTAKHYEIACGEAMECAASLDVLELRKVIDSQRYEPGIRLLESVVAMLTKML